MEMRDEDFENLDPVDPPILLGEGLYPAKRIKQEARKYSYGEKLVQVWHVYISSDLTQYVVLSAFYNLSRDGGGRFDFGKVHSYRRDWIAANGGRMPPRNSLPNKVWEGIKVVEVRTVTRERRGPLHPSNYYSVVNRVVRPVEDGETFETLPLQPPGNTSKSSQNSRYR